jgi:transposase
MAKAYSMDLRERVLKDCDTGMRSEDVAQKYSVSASWVYDLRKKRREPGFIAPTKRVCKPASEKTSQRERGQRNPNEYETTK